MKKLILIFALLFSTPSYAEWTLVGKSNNGDTNYIDLGRIRKNDGYIYFWVLADYLKPNDGYISTKMYLQGDCKLFRLKYLTFIFHKEPMGKGDFNRYNEPDKEWTYPNPNGLSEITLKAACSL
jgi:hypothetical protein